MVVFSVFILLNWIMFEFIWIKIFTIIKKKKKGHLHGVWINEFEIKIHILTSPNIRKNIFWGGWGTEVGLVRYTNWTE